jgi:glycosyltransferase involved in cell wall biosynthesis
VTIAVVIPTFNHAHYLADAITSVLAQTRQADEIIVVDDGSTDDVAGVVDRFPAIRLIRQENRGLSAARNTGLRHCQTDYVAFLDADDRLLPPALETGLTCMSARPDSACVYGGYRRVSEDGRPLGPDIYLPMEGNPYVALLRQNIIGMHAAVLHRRDCLLAVGGYDETLRRNEDYDLYLRIAKRYPIASHPAIIAEYRRHGLNMSNNHVEQLKAVLRRLDAHVTPDPTILAAIRDGRRNIRNFYVPLMFAAGVERWDVERRVGSLLGGLFRAARWSPYLTARITIGFIVRRASRMVSQAAQRGTDGDASNES